MRALGAATALLTIFGCTFGTRVRLAPEPVAGNRRMERPLPFALVLEEVRVIAYGRETPASDSFVLRLTSRLRTAAMFANVFGPSHADLAPLEAARGRFQVEEQHDDHFASNLAKFFLFLATLYLLTPFLTFNTDAMVTLRCELELPDGNRIAHSVTAATTHAANAWNIEEEQYRAVSLATSMSIDALIEHLRADPILTALSTRDPVAASAP